MSALQRDGWTVETFGSLAEFRNGLNFIQADAGQSVKILGVADFQTRKVFSSSDALSQVKIKGNLREEDILKRDDLLFVRSNGNKDLIGRCALIDFDESERVSFSGFTIRARIIKRVLLPQLAAEIFSINFIKRQISEASGGTNISNLSQDILAKLQIPLPPLPEQRQIAAILFQWDNSLSILTKLIEAKRQQKRGLAEQLLTGKRRLKGFEGEWEEKRLGDVAEINPSENLEDFNSDFIRMEDVSEQGTLTRISGNNSIQVGLAGFSRFRNNDTLIAKITPCFENGKGAYVEGLSGVGLGSTEFLVLRPRSGQDSKWLYFLTRTGHFNNKGRTSMQGSGGQRRIPRDFVEKYEISTPPLPEQRAIASILSTLDEEITTLNALKAKVQEQKRGLMDLLLTGRVRVKVDELQGIG